MYSEVNYRGDEGYVADDLLAGYPELEFRCRAVAKAAGEGYFSLPEALVLYEVTEPQFMAYTLLQGNVLSATKELQLLNSLRILFEVYAPVASTFTGRERMILDELKELVH